MTEFKIPKGRIYQEDDEIKVENENNKRISKDQRSQEKVKDYK